MATAVAALQAAHAKALQEAAAERSTLQSKLSVSEQALADVRQAKAALAAELDALRQQLELTGKSADAAKVCSVVTASSAVTARSMLRRCDMSTYLHNVPTWTDAHGCLLGIRGVLIMACNTVLVVWTSDFGVQPHPHVCLRPQARAT